MESIGWNRYQENYQKIFSHLIFHLRSSSASAVEL